MVGISFVQLLAILTLNLSVMCSSSSFSNRDNFDIQPFLDPQVVNEVMPLPVLFPERDRHHVAVQPTVDVENDGSMRQLSLRPTTAFISRRFFNTSCAFTIPLFTFTTPVASPLNGEGNSPVLIANQMVYSLFAVLLISSNFFVPLFFSGIRDPTVTGRGQGAADSEAQLNRLLAPHPVVDFMGTGGLQKVGLDGRKCLLKTICEANRGGNGYGLLAMPFRMFFPPAPNGTLESKSSSAQIAAAQGAYQEDIDCGKAYPCLIDALDVASYLRDRWFYSSSSN